MFLSHNFTLGLAVPDANELIILTSVRNRSSADCEDSENVDEAWYIIGKKAFISTAAATIAVIRNIAVANVSLDI